MQNQNVDSNEIDKFNHIAKEWWDLSGSSRALHQINPLRLEYIQQRTNGIFGKNILDVGCGGGILSESLAKAGAIVTGLDMSIQALQVASEHAKQSGLSIDYIRNTTEQHAKTHAAQYDVVTCLEMLEHVPNPLSIIMSCSQLVKPNGHLFFSTINRNNKARLMMIVGAEYLARIVPKGTHQFQKFIRPAELINWCQQASLSEKHIIGLRYNLLRNNFSLSNNVNVNYILHTVK